MGGQSPQAVRRSSVVGRYLIQFLRLGPGGRVLIGGISVGHGLQRLLNAAWGVPVGWLPAWLYGLGLVGFGMAVLLLTPWRGHRRGCIPALLLASLWGTLLGDIFAKSFTSAFIAFCFAFYLILEASTVDDC